MTNEEAEEVLKKCDDLKKSIEETTKDFNTASKKIEIVNKMLKSERKKRWKIKRRRIQRVENSFYRSILAERNKLVIWLSLIYRQIDIWKREREKQMEDEADEEKKQNLIIEKELKIKELSKKKYDIQKLLCSIHTLYSKRLQKLADQGYKSNVHSSDIEEGILRTANREVEEYKEVVVSERKKKEW